jgi:hypothetical protein
MGILSALRAVWLGPIVALLTAGGHSAAAQAGPTPEYQLKAVFLFNFAQFVEWPDDAFTAPNAPLVIGVLGEDPFGSYLDETVQGETVNHRPLTVRRFRGVDEITNCHILFVGLPEQGRVRATLDSLQGRSVLTVSDGERFPTSGGIIGFVTEQSRIGLRINLQAAQAANLTISSKLLRPARIVSTRDN